MNEHDRRKLASEHRGEVADDEGVPLEPANLSQMISLRLDNALVAELRQLAQSRGTTVSDVLREAAADLLRAEHVSRAWRPVISYEVRMGRETQSTSDQLVGSGAQHQIPPDRFTGVSSFEFLDEFQRCAHVARRYATRAPPEGDALVGKGLVLRRWSGGGDLAAADQGHAEQTEANGQ